ncbi:fibroblast growth factor-binding protein 2 [Eublepharis macularius]|uniref:Fibroblast growth factor-binding protein 2 n=1 Tax=Eublepharis macularius TaxID=481883 RepID=A0AA97KFH9_EUBMA|nr:fibroblast growth factor-binding protein 2 [Eublepharis macularius]
MKVLVAFFVIFIGIMGVLGQNPKAKKRSHNEEIHFLTKLKDACTMNMSGNGEAKLRIECKNQSKAYWCEYTGKPSLCRPFNNNPRIYWNQIALELRKRTNACSSSLVLKPSVCQKAPPEAHMKQVASSIKPIPDPGEQAAAVNQAKAVLKLLAAAKQVKESQTGKVSSKKVGKPKPSPLLPIKPTRQDLVFRNDSEAMKLAWEQCWESLLSLYSYIISIFQG